MSSYVILYVHSTVFSLIKSIQKIRDHLKNNRVPSFDKLVRCWIQDIDSRFHERLEDFAGVMFRNIWTFGLEESSLNGNPGNLWYDRLPADDTFDSFWIHGRSIHFMIHRADIDSFQRNGRKTSVVSYSDGKNKCFEAISLFPIECDHRSN